MSSYTNAVEPTRIHVLNQKNIRKGDYILYWMQQSQRAEENHALEYAIEMANHFGQGVVVVFGLTDSYPEANIRHYTFMLEGLQEMQAVLAGRGIKMVVHKGAPPEVVLNLARRASAIVCDRGYLRHQRAWRREVAATVRCRVVQVESDVIVPVEVVSTKAEYAARTIRPKMQKHLDAYLKAVPEMSVFRPSLDLKLNVMPLDNIEKLLGTFGIDRSVRPVTRFYRGGTSRGKRIFEDFIQNKLRRYDAHHNQPQTDDVSHMSMYLHFGQISPLYIALRVKSLNHRLKADANIAAYLEELVVRRELAINFVYYTPDYDTYSCLPAWARQTLAEHKQDKRQFLYTVTQLENAATHDPYWNAAMLEMKHTGFMHNYMRMYWGKKILEWSRTPEQAFKTTLAINNKYFIDGRDPNSYAGVAWTFGVHDRAWKERPVFGKVRYMAASGLERKCDIRAYVKKVEYLTRQR